MPVGWRSGLDGHTIKLVRTIEAYSSRGLFILSQPDHKGYVWIRLCVGHPYAGRNGYQRVHRYLMMRRLGRKLTQWEHVHHKEGAQPDTLDVYDLEVREEVDHGRYHYGKRLCCGPHIKPGSTYLWVPRDAYGRFTELPDSGASVDTSEVPF